jgi:hypothetical protein
VQENGNRRTREPERTATGVTRVREWRDGVPAEAESQGRTALMKKRADQARGLATNGIRIHCEIEQSGGCVRFKKIVERRRYCILP